MTVNKNYIIVAVLVLLLLVAYLEGRSKTRERIVADTTGATPGFDGYLPAKELADTFSTGWFGNTSAKVRALQKLDGLSNSDLKVTYNTFARQFSKRFGGKTMKQVIADEWLVTFGSTDYQARLVAKFDALGLP